MRLSLRTLLYLVVAAAITVAWGIEHVRLATQLAKTKEHADSFGLLGRGMSIGVSVVRRRRANDLQYADDQELLQNFHEWREGSPDYDDALYQVCLSEMLRRGMHQRLREHYDQLRAEAVERSGQGTAGLGVPGQGAMLLPLLTAVRRAEGRPDPVRIRLTYQAGEGPAEPPLIVPAVENVDSEQQEIYLHTAGDTGTRRNGCWQIQLVNSAGRRMPLADKVMTTGGFAGFRTLGFGQQDECDSPLDVRSYVQQPPPGHYKLQVLFCTVDIASDPDLTGLIVTRSEPVDVIVSHSASQAGIAVIPLLILLYGALLATAAAIAIGRWRNSRRTPLKHISWRDATAWAMLIALSLSWHHDAHHLDQQIQELQLDEDAAWTWRLAE